MRGLDGFDFKAYNFSSIVRVFVKMTRAEAEAVKNGKTFVKAAGPYTMA
jgi:hypothetical protein